MNGGKERRLYRLRKDSLVTSLCGKSRSAESTVPSKEPEGVYSLRSE
jgi:hypothetical protein